MVHTSESRAEMKLNFNKKDAVHRTTAPGTRVLRDQLYPLKSDSAKQTTVLTPDTKVLPATECRSVESML